MLLIAVALFAMVTYAFLQGSRGNVGMMTSEAAKVAGYTSQDCTNSFNMGMKRLNARGCGDMISMNPDGSNSNPGAPSDGSCSLYHPNGGGAKPCNVSTTPTVCTVPTIGDVCPDGSIYAGLSPDGNVRMYTTPSDGPSIPWNNGNSSDYTETFIMNQVTGAANTAALVTIDSDSATPGDQPHQAAQYCHDLGAQSHNDWYLPARDELEVLLLNRNDGSLAGTINGSYYWGSNEHIVGAGQYLDQDGLGGGSGMKHFTNTVRCVRKD